MFCTKCGAQIKEGVKYCIRCGNPVVFHAAAQTSGTAQIPVYRPVNNDPVLKVEPLTETKQNFQPAEPLYNTKIIEPLPEKKQIENRVSTVADNHQTVKTETVKQNRPVRKKKRFSRIRPLLFAAASLLIAVLWYFGNFVFDKYDGKYQEPVFRNFLNEGELYYSLSSYIDDYIPYLAIGIMAFLGIGFLLNLISAIIGKRVRFAKGSAVIGSSGALCLTCFALTEMKNHTEDYESVVTLDVPGWIMIGICVCTLIYAVCFSRNKTGDLSAPQTKESIRQIKRKDRITSGLITALLAVLILILYAFGGFHRISSYIYNISMAASVLDELFSDFLQDIGSSRLNDLVMSIRFIPLIIPGLAILLNLIQAVIGRKVAGARTMAIFSGISGLVQMATVYLLIMRPTIKEGQIYIGLEFSNRLYITVCVIMLIYQGYLIISGIIKKKKIQNVINS